jgi:hypothetical protein
MAKTGAPLIACFLVVDNATYALQNIYHYKA